MINILAEVSAVDLPQFMEVFSSKGLAARRRNRSLESQIFETQYDKNRIFILFKWDNRENFENFLNDAEVREKMKLSKMTAPPKFVFLDRVTELQS